MSGLGIELHGVSKSYYNKPLFRNINKKIPAGQWLNISGSNGSGKTTLIKIFSGFTTPSTGDVLWQDVHRTYNRANIFSQISLCSPSVKLPSMLTLRETVENHFIFRKRRTDFPEDILGYSHLNQFSGTPVKYLSSGMYQRLLLSLCIATQSQAILLDEPTSFLDLRYKEWYRGMLSDFRGDRTVIIASNSEEDLKAEGDHLHLD